MDREINDCSRQNCKRRIFRAADLHFSDKRISAFYDILFHITPLFRFYYHTCTFPYVFSISLFYLIFFIISFQSAVFILPHIRLFLNPNFCQRIILVLFTVHCQVFLLLPGHFLSYLRSRIRLHRS